ncbi:MAG: leucine-rich repeat domain-containing protein [Verrucomicrobia bacterium]|nr:leucine-rich repeat domain-containing protein [Verrucomicrobiota bacterium]
MDLSFYSAAPHSSSHMGPPPFPPLSVRKGSLEARERKARVAALVALYFNVRGERPPDMEALCTFAQWVREKPPEVTECEDLNLSCERLRQIPFLMTCFRGLTKLNVSDNALETLPEAIGALSNLTWLNASRNHLFTLPVALSCLSKLEVLKLSKNQLGAIILPVIRGGGIKVRLSDKAFNNVKVI